MDDGSDDDTFIILKEEKKIHTKIIRLAKNSGHQSALLAGIQFVKEEADCIITIDADLQDDLSVIEKMVEEYKSGADIVCGVRENRNCDSSFKRYTARAFYRLMNNFGVKLIENHADFRLLSQFAVKEILKYGESNIFLRGLLTLVTDNVKIICYKQNRRLKGKSKYNIKQMISLATRGITSFTTTPIRIITYLGIFIFFLCLFLSCNVLYVFLTQNTVPGWASITLPLYFLGGVQLLGIGVIGEYIGKIYFEAKKRPHYHIREVIE
ncbi:glycosyltransferase involved in cell wall biosynthesis [Sphingobacterium sp. BIGb0165]|nr:glycosyltransferase involved in cell wall biosynthesis [Sphingobacterium sp. BIGb0165]